MGPPLFLPGRLRFGRGCGGVCSKRRKSWSRRCAVSFSLYVWLLDLSLIEDDYMAKSPKQKYQRGRRKCIFCGKFQVSREHVLPAWLKELFPRDEHSTHTFGTINPSSIIGIPRIVQRKRPGHSGTAKVRVVCESCNSGWLSRLEEDVKPILIPLINGKRCGLPLDMQKTLATWAAKTAMTAEQARPRERGISQAERSWLKEHLIPPSYWSVWLAGYDGESWCDLGMTQQRGRLQESPISSPKVESHYIHATTLGIGRVVFLVVGTMWKPAPEVFSRFDGKGLFRIWPSLPRSILWPPNDILGDPQVNALANILSQSGVFNQSLNPLANWTFAI